MDRRLLAAFVISLAIVITSGLGGASATNAPSSVSVSLSRRLSVASDLHVSFKASSRLPHGGYYYGVVVLESYRHYSSQAPPLCAISSDMGKTQYGFPDKGRVVHLTLVPAASAENRWCGGIYVGAIYAVPHRPPCNREYQCSRKSAQEVHGVVAPPKVPGRPPEREPYSYPGGLPKPIDRSTRIVGHFKIVFPAWSPYPDGGKHVDGPICPGWSISLPCGCPNAESPHLTDLERDLPAGYGWVEIVLSYPPRSGLSKLKSCPGGIAIEDQAGTAIASAGYTDGPPEDGPGIASGSTTDIVLASGTWHAVARAGEEPFVSATFTVVAGQGTKIAIQLP